MQIRTAIVICSVVLSLALIWAIEAGPLRAPEAAFDDFTAAKDRAEDQLTDPLVLANSRVRPIVLDAVKDRNFKLRRYAISYLGCARHTPATETLLLILNDNTEKEEFRGDALEALWKIDRDNSLILAKNYVDRSDHLGRTARRLIDGTEPLWCRSWIDAFFEAHD